MIILLRSKEKYGMREKTNGNANPVVTEHNLMTSIFSPINPLKIGTSGFDSLVMR